MPRTLLVILIACTAALASCGESARTPPRVTTPAKQPGEPIIRVRIDASASKLTIVGPTKVQIAPADRPTEKRLVKTPITLALNGGRWTGADLPQPLAAYAKLAVTPLGPYPLAIGKRRYDGTIRLVPRRDSQRRPIDRFDVVNHVPLEKYLPGVLDQELYDYWHPSAFLAQAIAARTYAIDRIIDDGPGRHYDLNASQASQAYIGVSANALARRAAADSAGLVLTSNGRVFTAFYSSCCGGVPISPRQAYGSSYSVPALEPKAPCPYCRGSRHYDWGPITRDRAALSKRIAAWGANHNIAIKNLRTITSIQASEFHLHRPTRFVITDNAGKRYALRGDSLRSAVNFASSSRGIARPSKNILSGYVKATVEGDTVRFHDGHGFGHGVGLCQYGAEAMARSNKTPEQILAFYYPTAKIERAY